MNKDQYEIIKDARMAVSSLIFKVLTAQVSVRDALVSFPVDIKDPSIQCAWHALAHYEADEDIRLKDYQFASEQDEYLEMLAFTLQKGDPLPQNIIISYNDYYEEAMIPRSKGFKSWFKSLFKFII